MLRCSVPCTQSHFVDKLQTGVFKNRRSLFGKYFNVVLIRPIQNILLRPKWFDERQKSTRSSANAGMAHGTGLYGKWGWGMEWAWGHWDPKLTQSDNGRRQPACQVSSRSVHPFRRNSRLCVIRGKNAGVGNFRKTFRG